MADDWEDWEREDFTPSLPAVKAAEPAAKSEYETVGQAVLAKATEPDASKFAGEDEEEEAAPSYSIPSQPKKKIEKKYDRAEDVEEAPLDDPIAEKLRQQRLVEEADFRAARELFGDTGTKSLEAILPKSVKDFEEYAQLLAARYIQPHSSSKNYKAFLKHLLKLATDPLTSEDAKELEATAGTIRAEKVKAEKAAAAAKSKVKKTVNVGKGGASAGLDDYTYDEPLDDDYDFM
eukprot:jgi/Chrzof1/12666/Cz07g03020.t1